MLAKVFENSIPSRLRESLRLHFDGRPVASSEDLTCNGSGTGSSCGPMDGCSYSRTHLYKCSTDNGPDGKPVRKCEKKEQLLRRCAGRPEEVLESRTEYTEEDASKGTSMDLDFDIHGGEVPSLRQRGGSPSRPHSLHKDLDFFSEGLTQGFEHFLKAAEDLTGELFDQFGINSSEDGVEIKFPKDLFRRFSSEAFDKEFSAPRPRSGEQEPLKKPDYNDLSRDFEEI